MTSTEEDVADVENPKELVQARPSVAFADNHEEIPHDEHNDSSRNSSSDDDVEQDNDRHGFLSSDDAMSGDALVDEDDTYQVDLEEQGGPLPQRLSHAERSGSVLDLFHRNSDSRPTHQRTSSARDLETGVEGGARAQTAFLRNEDSLHPQSATMRRRRKIFKLLGAGRDSLDEGSEENEGGELGDSLHTSKHGRYLVSSQDVHHNDSERSLSRPHVQQYRLQAVRPKTNQNACLKFMGLGDAKFTIYEGTELSPSCSFCGFNPNDLVIHFLHWIFRQHLVTVLLTAVTLFFALTISFGLLIWFVGYRHPYCIGGVAYDADHFADAFTLSWTTFSTVGYGLIHAGISTGDDVDDIQKCTGITVLVTLEAFVGILFASMWGAIIFIRLSRIQSFAQVSFSEAIVIRYGSGVAHPSENDEQSDDGGSHSTLEDETNPHIPCPMLEFRLINRMHNIHGGEIIDATVVVVASIDATQACPTLKGATTRRRRGGKKGKKRRRHVRRDPRTEKFRGDSSFSIPERFGSVGSAESLPILKADAARQTQELEEDPSGHLVSKKILCKLECESQEHPFFKRVWVLRHKLDDQSPLLRSHTRMMVKHNNGYWPMELNTAEGVRAAFHFDQLLVSLSGTSNADANSVYAQHIYDVVDTNVGYRFVNMLYRDPNDNALKVDPTLLSDVMEQAGGGGEEFSSPARREKRDMFVL